MTRYLLSTFLLLVFPIAAQIPEPLNRLKQDTAEIKQQIRETHNESAEILDSIAAIVERRDSIEQSKHGVFVRVYNVDRPDGKRQVWTWVYDIKGRDTIFNRVEKRWTRWDK